MGGTLYPMPTLGPVAKKIESLISFQVRRAEVIAFLSV